MTAITKIAADNEAEVVAILRRVRRKTEIMAMDADRRTSARQDAEEIRALMDIALRYFREV